MLLRGAKEVAKFLFMAKFKKVSSLLEKKRIISKEIEDLQNECTHSGKSIKSIKEHEVSSTFIFRWICNNCEKMIVKAGDGKVFIYTEEDKPLPEPEPPKTYNIYGEFD